MNFSHSKIAAFKQCKQLFKYKFIDKIKVEKPKRLTKGVSIHHLLENYDDYKQNPEKYDTYKEFFSIVDNFANSKLGKDILNKKSVKEYCLKMDSNLKPTFNDYKFIGYIDRININEKPLYAITYEDNKICDIDIIDFKTGKYVDSKYQDYSQLITYSLYFFQRYPQFNSVKVRYVYVEHNLENTLILYRNNLDIHINNLLKDIQEIENCTDFTTCPDILCNWCDYKDICNDFKISEFVKEI